jgi:hypothetical protein
MNNSDESGQQKSFSQEKLDVTKQTVSPEEKYDPLRDVYICYSSKLTAKDKAILGYGVYVTNQKTGTLYSPCEYISLEEFKNGTKRSTIGQIFTHWMPILIHSDMWDDVSKLFVDFNISISSGLGLKGKPVHEIVIKTCASLMNSLILGIINNKENTILNDKFINGYFAIYRIMAQYAKKNNKIVEYVNNELEQFKKKPEKRTKKFVSNLGELLIYLTISDKYNWIDISNVFLEECDTRNVLWYLGKYPELQDIKHNLGRDIKVFDATEVSRTLIMFQVRFSQIVTALTTEMMDSNFGLAPENLRVELKDTYKSVIKIKKWNGYFKWLGVNIVNPQERCKQLINAVRRFAERGYC